MTEMIGRSAEFASATASIGSRNQGAAGVIIEGEPGIGKTTLWLAASQHARDRGARLLVTRASSAESGLAYTGLADVLADVDRDLWADLPAPQRQGLAGALLVDDGASVPVIDPRAVGAALLTVLERLATRSAVVVAIDDVQWLDGSSSAAMNFAARRLTGPVRWLCTARTGVASTIAFPGADVPIDHVRLAPLVLSELRDVLAARLAAPVDRATLARVLEISGGNPYYAVELAREMVHRESDGNIELPASLAAVTRARLGRIGNDARDALLAIAGLAVPTVRIVADATGVTPRRLLEQLSDAEAEGIIAIDGDRLRFTHPLLAHAVHSGATSTRRRTMHRRLAQVVTEAEPRARHLALADPVGEPKTLAALDSAADIARRRAAPVAAVELLEMAIGLGGGTAQRRIRLAECLFDAGDLAGARSSLKAAIDSLPMGSERAEAMQRLALVRVHDDSFPEAIALSRRALSECPEDSAVQVDVLTVLSFAELNSGNPQRALQTIGEAVSRAERMTLTGPLLRAISLRAVMRFMNGDGVSASDLDRAADLDEPLLPVPLALQPSVQRALLVGWAGDLAGGREGLTAIAHRCEAAGQDSETMFVAFQAVMFDLWRGDLGRAAVEADAAVQRARRLGGNAARFMALSTRGAVAAYQGRVDDAERDLAEALSAGADSGYVLMSAWTIGVRGFLELSAGRPADALATFETLLPATRLAPRFTELTGGSHLPDAAEAMITVGRLDDAEYVVSLLERNGERLGRAWMLAAGGRCRALLSAARGDVASALVHADAAMAQYDRIEMPFERARTLLVTGRLQRRMRRWRAATETLTEALTEFERLGVPLWTAQARAELERGTAGRRRSPGLTPTEERVAELVATGMTNQDVAASLHVTRKTVEVNLSRIYHKLGIHSRIELYRVLHGRA